MKISLIETDKRMDSSKSTSYGIQSYGADNDYPQRVQEILAASVTGGSCCNVYASFINGKGFIDEETSQQPCNREGERMDDLLHAISSDLANFGGFALHLNYNANHFVTSVHHIPFEHVRLGLPDESGRITNVKIHQDWGRRNTNIRAFKKEDIVEINLYDPTPDAIDAQVLKAEGWENYTGQVYYYSRNGKNIYPLPIFDCALTDMNTEEAISDITNRNAVNGFLPAGLLIDICQDPEPEITSQDPQQPSLSQPNDTELAIQMMQGSKNAAKVAYAQVGSREEIPEFVKFNGTNYDKEFTTSRDAAKDSIGRAFNQPPILRAENVSAGFSTDMMQQSYKYYNSVTTNERLTIERVLTEIFKNYILQIEMNFEIAPLTYEVETTLAERLGGNLTAFNSMLESGLRLAQKRAIAKTLYGLSQEEIDALFPVIPQTQPQQ